MKVCKNCQKKEVENEAGMILSCDKCDNIWRKAFIDIKKVNDFNFQTGNKTE